MPIATATAITMNTHPKPNEYRHCCFTTNQPRHAMSQSNNELCHTIDIRWYAPTVHLLLDYYQQWHYQWDLMIHQKAKRHQLIPTLLLLLQYKPPKRISILLPQTDLGTLCHGEVQQQTLPYQQYPKLLSSIRYCHCQQWRYQWQRIHHVDDAMISSSYILVDRGHLIFRSYFYEHHLQASSQQQLWHHGKCVR